MPRPWCQICWNCVYFQLWSTLPELELNSAAETHGHRRWGTQFLSEPPQHSGWGMVLHHKLLRTMGVLWGMIDNDACWWSWWCILRCPSVIQQLLKQHQQHQLSQRSVQVELSFDICQFWIHQPRNHLTIADVDCEVSSWRGWGDCSKTCGRGTQTKTRLVLTPRHESIVFFPFCQLHFTLVKSISFFVSWLILVLTLRQGNGKMCPPLKAARHCNPQDCPIGFDIPLW